MKIKGREQAVTEIIGAMLLIAMTITVFAVVYSNVLSDGGPDPETYSTVVGNVEHEDVFANTVAFENQGGETLGTETEIVLTIGGPFGDKKSTTIEALSSFYPFLQDGWNIGEKIYPAIDLGLGDLTNVQIDATIVDKVSNSMVFWGRLQEGYVEPPFGRGGLWHFNESLWNQGVSGEVKDSSGNNNHGTAYNGATTTNDVVSPNANRSGIFNEIDDNDYVEVIDSYSLDITDQITMEAWIKPFNVTASGTARLEDKFGFTPYINHVSKNLYVVVSEDARKKGMIQTINITPQGQLSDILYKFENFGQSKGERNLRPIITHITNDVYLLAYIDFDLYVHLKTFNISSNGIIDYTGNELVFNDNKSKNNVPNRPSIIKVTEDIFAISYWIDYSDNAVGILKTVNISSNGTIEYTGNMLIFDDIQGYEPSIIHVADDVFAIAYRGHSDWGIIKSFNISSNGMIEYTGNMLIFDDIQGYEPSIIHVADDVFAIAYRGHSDLGIIKTYKILTNGTIISAKITKIFDSSSCFNPCIIRHSEKYYVITYATNKYPSGKSIGNYVTIEIANNGSITILGPSMVFEEERCYTPLAVRISERIFAIVYEGKDAHSGCLITVLVEYPSDVYSKGIYKLGSYGIYANATKVYGNINTKTINASIIPDSWNYIVLTYNKNASSDQMKLYVNGTVRASRSLTEAIKITDSNLFFGDLLFGLIDEIAIHDEALTLTEIQKHFNNPGVFEG